MSVDIRQGDCRTILPTLPEKSVHCCITSPPYWGLRDYGIAPTVWGGDPACAHEWGSEKTIKSTPQRDNSGGVATGATGTRGEQASNSGRAFEVGTGAFCRLCAAWRGVHGLEPTIELYVQHSVEVFREVRRVLRDDGTLWINLGDSYAGGGRSGGSDDCKQRTNVGSLVPRTPMSAFRPGAGRADGVVDERGQRNRNGTGPVLGLKAKDLCMIPARVALALQADGWWLRSEIVWAKPNPMPESVTDRPTSSHEKIFLLAKSAKYFYDADAVREESICDRVRGTHGYSHVPGGGDNSGLSRRDTEPTRNLRNVWTFATEPFPDAHFATYPTELVKRCILAGCPKGGTVLDPFGGSGTTGLVADRLERNAILIEANPAYVDMARQRIAGDAPLFSQTASIAPTATAT